MQKKILVFLSLVLGIMAFFAFVLTPSSLKDAMVTTAARIFLDMEVDEVPEFNGTLYVEPLNNPECQEIQVITAVGCHECDDGLKTYPISKDAMADWEHVSSGNYWTKICEGLIIRLDEDTLKILVNPNLWKIWKGS